MALIFGMLLTLTAGVWGSALAAASAWCMHDASAPAAPDEHDCCRAKIGESNTHHSGSQQTSHDASHENSTTHAQAAESHAGMNCGGAEASATPEIGGASLGAGGLSRAPCCAGGSGKTPATAVVVAPEQNKVKRVEGGACREGASRLFTPVTLDVSHLAPSRHAPPSSPERRHVLISIFLI
ncbi:MAG: hypothetical protein LC803_08580 [Acidobacteria bacterium]|nr:hypothetical protein [Acidobacteriota bacterium]